MRARRAAQLPAGQLAAATRTAAGGRAAAAALADARALARPARFVRHWRPQQGCAAAGVLPMGWHAGDALSWWTQQAER